MLFLKRLLLLLPWIRNVRERDLQDELRNHERFAAEDACADGLSPAEAQDAARRQIGSSIRIVEDVRAEWRVSLLDGVLQDIRYALRAARRAPLFTVTAVGSIAIGIAAAATVFAIVNGVLLKPLPYREPDRLVFIREIVPPLQHIYPTLPVNVQHFRTWRTQLKGFEHVAAVYGSTGTLTGSNEPERISIGRTSANLLAMLGTPPVVGRDFTSEDERPGAPAVAIISYRMWQRRLAGAPVRGTSIVLDGKPVVIIGVLPDTFWFPLGRDLAPLAKGEAPFDVFTPLSAMGDVSQGWRGDYDYSVIARLAKGVPLDQARAELNTLESRIDRDHDVAGGGLSAQATPLPDVVGAPLRMGLWFLMAAVVVLLAIVGVNLAGLLIARTTMRTREFSMRTALGASRRRLFSQVLIETGLIVFGGGVIGLTIAEFATRALAAVDLLALPGHSDIEIDRVVVQFTVLALFLFAVLVGWAPAWRIAGRSVHTAMRDGGNTTTGGSAAVRFRAWLVGAEMGLSTMLLIAAALLLASMSRLLHVPIGLSAEREIAATVTINETLYRTQESRNQFFGSALETLRRLPGVTSAAFVSRLPLTGESQVNDITPEGGQPAVDASTGELLFANIRFISPDYLRTIGIPLVSGRDFRESDRGHAVALVSKRLSDAVWPNQDPIGKRFGTGSGVGIVAIVGVVGDVPNGRIENGPTPIGYVPYWHRAPFAGDIVVRSETSERAAIPSLRQAIWQVNPQAAITSVRTIADLKAETLAPREFQVRLVAGFAGVALFVTLLGVYGVVAYAATQRRKEIGIRVALGANRREVVTDVMATGLRPVIGGLAVGTIGALSMGRFIQSLLFGVQPGDPMILSLTIGALFIASAAAALLPARAAATRDPLSALRSDS